MDDLPNGGDGVEEVGNGDLIVSEWIGNVFYVYADGRKVLMLNRQPEHKNTADQVITHRNFRNMHATSV